jgi:hypothetical protein
MTTQNPFTKAYTENLMAALERTREELKNIVEELAYDHPGLSAQLNRMVNSISLDLHGDEDNPCTYIHSHTRAWCGYDQCRES